MQLLHCWKITGGDGLDRFFENGGIVGVGKQVSVVEHVYPNLSFREDFCGVGIFDHLSRSDGIDDQTGVFQIIFQRLPRQFERVFEALDNAFLFQLVEGGGAVLKSFAEEDDAAVEILEALLPAYVGFMAE